MHLQHAFLSLLDAPGIRERTQAVFTALLANCEDTERLCSFILESVITRVHDKIRSEVVLQRGYELKEAHLVELSHVTLQSEALNEEARRWMADFLLYPIAKRTRATRKSTMLPGKRKRYSLQGSSYYQRLGHQFASTKSRKQFCDVELFPESDDPVRLTRFRVLVDIFCGGYQEALSDQNLASRSNRVLMDRRLVSMFDSGAFHLACNGEQLHAVSLWDGAAALISLCPFINRKSTLRPRKASVWKSSTGPDRELVSLHALIVQTWDDTGLAERLVTDMELVDNMPSTRQQVCVLGDSLFAQILQHRLALL